MWSHSYLRALCSSSSCSLTVFSSFSRAVSVPFTHVYTTSMGMGRQSLKHRDTGVTQTESAELWPRFPPPQRTLCSGMSEWVCVDAALHLVQFKENRANGLELHEVRFLQKFGSWFAHFCKLIIIRAWQILTLYFNVNSGCIFIFISWLLLIVKKMRLRFLCPRRV